MNASRHLLAATGLAMARLSASLNCAPQKIESQQAARRRPQQQQQQQPAVISDAAVEAAEQMARLLLQAIQEYLFICCRVAFWCECWEHYCQGITFAGCGKRLLSSPLQEEDADKQQAAAKAARRKSRKQARSAGASDAAAAAAAPGPSGTTDAAEPAVSVQPGAVSVVSTPTAAADAAYQPGASAGPPTADGQAANVHAWQLCPLTKVRFAASARLEQSCQALHMACVCTASVWGDKAWRQRIFTPAERLEVLAVGPNPQHPVVCTGRRS